MFGLGGVGKTSLIHRFLFNKFENNYTATIEDDYRQVITYNNHIVDVTVLDTAGSFQFPAMRRHAIQHGHGFIIVYAVDNPASLEEAKRLYNEVRSIKSSEDCPIILAGNKIDKSPMGKRKVTRDCVQRLLEDSNMNVEHIETSALINHNVALVFNKMIGEIDSRNMEHLSASVSHGNLHKSTTRLNGSSKNSLNEKGSAKSTNRIDRSYSMDDTIDEIKTARKRSKTQKNKFLKKFFSTRKPIRL